MTYDQWKLRSPDDDRPMERPQQSALERLGIESLSYVIRQYRLDVVFNSTLDDGQKARRIEMIDAALSDFGEE